MNWKSEGMEERDSAWRMYTKEEKTIEAKRKLKKKVFFITKVIIAVFDSISITID